LKKILFVSSFHPNGAGNVGAGEAVSGENIGRLLATGAEVHVLCIAPAYQRADQRLVRQCASYTLVQHSSSQSLLAILRNMFRGALWAPWLFTRVSPHAIAVLKQAIRRVRPDEVWFDFPSSMGFGSHTDEPRKVYFVHDIVSQKIQRSVLKRILAPMVRRVESALFRYFSRLVVLSEKDRQLAITAGFSGDIDISQPSRPRVGTVDGAIPIEEVVSRFGKCDMVFFGHMGRAENHWSIVWFILGCYPMIRRSCPQTKLWVLGIRPRALLRFLGRTVPGVEVIGAVDDPMKAFEKGAVCVAPILFGAGVKIKVIQMLDAGASVVATQAGAEGVADNERLKIVQWNGFAAKVIDVLTDRNCRG
jgi:hypothetical protein